MATFAEGGRITASVVADEIARLRQRWGRADPLAELVGRPLDRFERVQLADVVEVCRRSRTPSEAGRALFAVSRTQRTTTNDADRLRKYLARYELDFASTQRGGS
jgi:transcriptional regulatory protein RtcR